MKKIDPNTVELVFELHAGQCDICGARNNLQIHHRLSNTKVNRKLFPLFINSIFNLQLLCVDCHLTRPIKKIYSRAAEVYEKWLKYFVELNINVMAFAKGRH